MKFGNVKTLKLKDISYPTTLRDIPSAPAQLFISGSKPENWINLPKVAIVGSRKVSSYGRKVTQDFAGQLARAGVVIISGLALGVDSIAHQAALDNHGITIAVLPTPLDRIYPASHYQLSVKIIESGGSLISEYKPGTDAYKVNFIARNRIVSGLADVLVITEAAINSGTMHTARFALEQGKTVMAVPGNITSLGSEGCNNLIKSGAIPVTDVSDILFGLGLKPAARARASSFKGTVEQMDIIRFITEGLSSQEELAIATSQDAATLTSNLTMLEIAGVTRSVGGGNWILA